jgi:hypothetical protein
MMVITHIWKKITYCDGTTRLIKSSTAETGSLGYSLTIATSIPRFDRKGDECWGE